MLKIDSDNMVLGEDIYFAIQSKDKNYSRWINRAIDYADLKKGKDFIPELDKSNGGRPSINYKFTIEAAKEICLLERNARGKEIRQWLISLSNKVENLELMTVKQAAFAVKVINCLKYIENQKEAKEMHKTTFVAKNIDITNPKYIYAEFEKYRSKINGWTKEEVNLEIENYLNNHSGYNRARIDKANMQTKLSIMDIGEAVRVACLDILYSKNTDANLSENFARLCKNLANEMKIQPEKKNETNLFHEKQALENVKSIKIDKL